MALTGVTSALLLGDAGLRVALVERGSVGGIDTGCTSAHLTSVVDAHLDDSGVDARSRSRAGGMGRRVGRHWAGRKTLESNGFAIDCEFSFVPEYCTYDVDAGAG